MNRKYYLLDKQIKKLYKQKKLDDIAMFRPLKVILQDRKLNN